MNKKYKQQTFFTQKKLYDLSSKFGVAITTQILSRFHKIILGSFLMGNISCKVTINFTLFQRVLCDNECYRKLALLIKKYRKIF